MVNELLTIHTETKHRNDATRESILFILQLLTVYYNLVKGDILDIVHLQALLGSKYTIAEGNLVQRKLRKAVYIYCLLCSGTNHIANVDIPEFRCRFIYRNDVASATVLHIGRCHTSIVKIEDNSV